MQCAVPGTLKEYKERRGKYTELGTPLSQINKCFHKTNKQVSFMRVLLVFTPQNTGFSDFYWFLGQKP